MSQLLCTINGCKRASRALCHCCQQNLCISHLNEHNDLLNSQLNPLVDEINILGNRLKTLNIQEKTRNYHQKLEQWRIDCHQKIDLYFEQKYQQLNQLIEEKIEKQQQEVTRVQSKLVELIREQDATHQDIDMLTSNINHLQKEINNIEQNPIHINIRPLLIDIDYIHINETDYQEFNLSTLSPPYKTINRSEGTARALANNDQYLLFHDAPNLCLVDRNLTLIRKSLSYHGRIADMCWSSTLKRFIVLELNDVYLVNENTMMIERIETIKKERWMSCTCSDTSLYLSTNVYGASILEFSLLPTIRLIKEWKCPDSCLETEDITCIKYNNETLALLIRNNLNKTMRMELKSSITFERIWSFQLDLEYNKEKTLRCCSLTDNEWLIADREKCRLIHVSKDGNMKRMLTYNDIPCFHLFHDDEMNYCIK
ncbi:unnamed protein product [Rotaria sordida]|uniref:Uncharacterized protein n=1 Tax=Rotaria sordida TaxID=392033 RepID=A0A819G6S1_9BILA|nr:unnamed protein product [Rotaria sordida]